MHSTLNEIFQWQWRGLFFKVISEASFNHTSDDVRVKWGEKKSTFWAGNVESEWLDCVCVSELKDEVVYYDVCEDPEELQSMVHTGTQQAEPPAVRQLRRRLHTLEAKRGNICARRAYIRNKKVSGTSTTDLYSEGVFSTKNSLNFE